jgi:hypothetical protein
MDGVVIFKTGDQPFELKDIDGHHTLVSKINNIVFPVPGKYWVEIMLDGDLVLNYPIILKEMKEGAGEQNR